MKLTDFNKSVCTLRKDPDYLVSWALIAGWEELPAAHSETVTSQDSVYTNDNSS